MHFHKMREIEREKIKGENLFLMRKAMKNINWIQFSWFKVLRQILCIRNWIILCVCGGGGRSSQLNGNMATIKFFMNENEFSAFHDKKGWDVGGYNS